MQDSLSLANCASVVAESGCSRCHGSGQEPHYHTLCRQCGGSGLAAAPWCPDCHGPTAADSYGPRRCDECEGER